MVTGKQLDAFETAKEEETDRYQRARREIERQIESLEKHQEHFDSGLSDIEDRNEIRALQRELEYLDREHEIAMQSLSIPTKDYR